jgi:hypothetical protein
MDCATVGLHGPGSFPVLFYHQNQFMALVRFAHGVRGVQWRFCRTMDSHAVLVDVDHDLFDENGGIRADLRRVLRRYRSQGTQVFLWSAGGLERAREVARVHGVADLVHGYLDRPHSLTSHVPCAVVEPYGCVSSEDDSWQVLVESILDRCGE